MVLDENGFFLVFEEMVKAYDKCKKVVEKEGHFKQYIRSIAELETYINDLWTDTEWRKSASKNNSTALSKLRQRIRKYNKDFENEIANFRAHPELYPEEEKVLDAASKGGAGDESDESSDEESGSDEKSSSDEETSEDEKKPKARKVLF